MTALARMVAGECRRQRGRFWGAALFAAVAAGASVALLGLSGWFITASSEAGIAGTAAAAAFNALLPSAGIRLLAILRTGCRYGERVVGHDAALRAMSHLRPALFRALAAAPASQAMAWAAGDATARLVQDVGEMETALVQRAPLCGAAMAGASGVGLMLIAGPRPAAALTAILAAVLIAARLLAARLDQHGRGIPSAQGSLRAEVAAVLAAAPELRAYGLEAWAAERVRDRSAALLAVQSRVTAGSGAHDLVLATGSGVAVFGALLLAWPGGPALAALAALGAAASVEGFGAVLRVLQHRGRLQAAQHRLDVLVGPARATGPRSSPAGAELGLPGLATRFRRGQIVGITGPSGCGKTTLLETLMALRPALPRAISIGGMDLAGVDVRSARRMFALAPQEAGLLAGTVRENLLLADPAAAEPVLWGALHDAVLDERVRALPQGLDTWIGENGMNLSGGERRRLVLARAYVRNAPWLLLDEPTEGLDAASETAVVRRLQARLASRRQGALIVSHRNEPLRICDVTITMAAGQVAAIVGRQWAA